jgi:arylsulfatase A-like enzyme
LVCSVATAAAAKPNLILLLADDLGWADTAVYNENSPTPNILNVSKQGIRLDRHYVFRYCSPTRRSALTGRFPNHLTTVQPDGNNLCSDFMPLAFSLLSEKMTGAGYSSHFVGKGHLGYQTMDHLPINRGFASHVGFLAGSEKYAHGGGSENASSGSHDLWHTGNPAPRPLTVHLVCTTSSGVAFPSCSLTIAAAAAAGGPQSPPPKT